MITDAVATEPLYDLDLGGQSIDLQRPVAALPRLSPTRGAIRFIIPPKPWELSDRGFGGYRPFPTWDRRQARLSATIARWRRTATVTRHRITDTVAVATGRASIHTDRDYEACWCAICDPDDDYDDWDD